MMSNFTLLLCKCERKIIHTNHVISTRVRSSALLFGARTVVAFAFVECMQEPLAISLHLSEALTLSTALLLLSRQGHLSAFGSAQLLLFEYSPRWSSITACNRLRTGSKNM